METITSYMQQDHDEIDAIAGRAVDAAQAGDAAALAREGTEFLRRLRLHIDMEEQVLFPAFEQRTGMAAAGPSAQMRVEHEQMRPILARMEQAVGARDAAAYQGAAKALLDILTPHNVKEERIMYPMLDNVAGADAQSLLANVKQMAG